MAGRSATVLERAVLERVPGFTFLKSMTRDMVGLGTGTEVAAVLARIEEAWVPSFVMERHTSGLLTLERCGRTRAACVCHEP